MKRNILLKPQPRFATQLDGSTQYWGNVTPNLPLGVGKSLLYMAIVKPNNVAGYGMVVGHYSDNSETARSWQLTINALKPYLFLSADGSSTNRRKYTAAVTIPSIGWTYLAALFVPSTTAALYINGAIDGGSLDGVIPASLLSTPDPASYLTVGVKGNRSGEFYSGQIGSVQVVIFNSWLEMSQSINVDAHQGYTTDGINHYIFDTGTIRKLDASWSLINQNTTPFSGLTGYGHIGDGCYWNGKLYVPIEYWTSCGDYNNMAIAVYDAVTLARESVNSVTASEVAGVTVDGSNGFIYVVAYCDGTKIWKYNLSDFTLAETITLSTPISIPQGIAIKNGKFYISGNNGTIYVVTLNGTIIDSFNVAGVTGSLEGIDYSGNQIGILLDNGGVDRKIHFIQEGTLPSNIASVISGINLTYKQKGFPKNYPGGTIVLDVNWKNGGYDKSGSGNHLTPVGSPSIVRI